MPLAAVLDLDDGAGRRCSEMRTSTRFSPTWPSGSACAPLTRRLKKICPSCRSLATTRGAGSCADEARATRDLAAGEVEGGVDERGEVERVRRASRRRVRTSRGRPRTTRCGGVRPRRRAGRPRSRRRARRAAPGRAAYRTAPAAPTSFATGSRSRSRGRRRAAFSRPPSPSLYPGRDAEEELALLVLRRRVRRRAAVAASLRRLRQHVVRQSAAGRGPARARRRRAARRPAQHSAGSGRNWRCRAATSTSASAGRTRPRARCSRRPACASTHRPSPITPRRSAPDGTLLVFGLARACANATCRRSPPTKRRRSASSCARQPSSPSLCTPKSSRATSRLVERRLGGRMYRPLLRTRSRRAMLPRNVSCAVLPCRRAVGLDVSWGARLREA